MNDNGLSAADVAAVTNHGGYSYPVFPYGGGNGFGNSIGGDWIILFFLLAMMNGGWGFGGGFGGFGGFGMGMDFMYPWLANGQKDIMTNTNNGFDTLHLSNQIEGTRDAIHGISNQICNSTADVTQAITNGFYGAEIAANGRQMANMQQNFDLSRQFADCCCENRLGIANLNSTILSENCADRYEAAKNTRDIIEAITFNSQSIKDQLCQDKIDAKNEKISELQRELQMADLKASQIAQTAELRLGQEREIDAMYQRLKDCPVGTVPVFGNQPIFTCSNSLNGNGCGCGNFGNTIV